MTGWRSCAALLRPLVDRLVRQVLQSKVIHTDDTPVDVLDRNRTQTRTGRFWAYLGDVDHPFTVFTYTPNRSRDGPREFLQGWSGHLQADAFGSAQALAYIRLLYDVEEAAKEQFQQPDPAARRPLSALRAALRQELAAPQLQQLHAWLHAQQARHGGPVLPKSPLGEAIAYALNQWQALSVYTTDGDLAIDNNASENALRRVALGRKNWLFCGSDHGGQTAAILFSFNATCQRRCVEPFAYLRDTLTRIAAHPTGQLDDLLPGANTPA